jgi:2-dehydropantoate 2-reductase
MRARHVLPNFRTAVVGAGAIGLYYGGKLAHFGREVHFLLRSDYEVLRKRGLRIRSKTEELHLPKLLAYRTTDEIGPCDLVLIALKTTSNPELPALLQPLLGEKTILLTLQNGLGNEEFLAEHFGAERVLGGLCYISLNRTAPGLVERFDSGSRLTIGEYRGFPQPRTHDIAWEFKRCGVVCSVVSDLILERWRKLVWNIPFNGLSVLTGLDTAAILEENGLRLLTIELMEETIAIANACGQDLPTALALEMVRRTKSMAPYKTSTLIDYEAGRPLEIESIWGEPLRRGQEAGVSAPRLEMLVRLLRALDRRRKE